MSGPAQPSLFADPEAEAEAGGGGCLCSLHSAEWWERSGVGTCLAWAHRLDDPRWLAGWGDRLLPGWREAVAAAESGAPAAGVLAELPCRCGRPHIGRLAPSTAAEIGLGANSAPG